MSIDETSLIPVDRNMLASSRSHDDINVTKIGGGDIDSGNNFVGGQYQV